MGNVIDWVIVLLCCIQMVNTVAVCHIYFMVMDINLSVSKLVRRTFYNET